MNIVITGANRGLGLGFVQHYLSKGDEVWACYRSNLDGLADIQSDKLHTVQLDVSQDFDANTLDFPESIDLLINNAGIYGPYGGQDLDSITSEAMLDVFNIDCVGPLRVVQQLKSASSTRVEPLPISALKWVRVMIMAVAARMLIALQRRV